MNMPVVAGHLVTLSGLIIMAQYFCDDRLQQQTDMMTRSMLVHEMVHYLQDLSGRYDNSSCDDHARREREAYAIQREYGIKASGSVLYIRMIIPPCPQS